MEINCIIRNCDILNVVFDNIPEVCKFARREVDERIRWLNHDRRLTNLTFRSTGAQINLMSLQLPGVLRLWLQDYMGIIWDICKSFVKVCCTERNMRFVLSIAINQIKGNYLISDVFNRVQLAQQATKAFVVILRARVILNFLRCEANITTDLAGFESCARRLYLIRRQVIKSLS